jgi:hypothetical protein
MEFGSRTGECANRHGTRLYSCLLYVLLDHVADDTATG